MHVITVSGKRISLLDPQPDQFDLDDIAHALSQICRWGGNTRRFFSVAEHSLLVARLVPPEYALAGLTHDFSEVVGDILSPWKRLLPEISQVEDRITRAIAERFGICFDDYHIIKQADLVAAATEYRDLMPGCPPLEMLKGIEPAPFKLFPMKKAAAKRALIQRFYELSPKQRARA